MNPADIDRIATAYSASIPPAVDSDTREAMIESFRHGLVAASAARKSGTDAVCTALMQAGADDRRRHGDGP